jgi:hypothetical protein
MLGYTLSKVLSLVLAFTIAMSVLTSCGKVKTIASLDSKEAEVKAQKPTFLRNVFWETVGTAIAVWGFQMYKRHS